MGKPDTKKVIEERVEVLYGNGDKAQNASETLWNKGWRLWGQPLIMFLLILAGLIGALIEEGWWDLFFCLLLAYPIFKTCWHYFSGGKSRTGNRS